MASPPRRLMAVMIRPAAASPRTNLLAPSMAPKNSDSCASSSRRRRASRSSMIPAARSASIDHLLAGHGVEDEAGRHLGDAVRALGDDREVHHEQDEEDDEAHHQAAADREAAEALDEVAGGAGALGPVKEDEAGGGHVERQPVERDDEEQRGEDREVERPGQPERDEEHQHGEADGEGEQDVEGGGRDGHHQERQHAQHGHGHEGFGLGRALHRGAHGRTSPPAARPVMR